MKQLLFTLNWAIGLFFLVIGLLYIQKSPWILLPMAIISSMFMPPIKKIAYRMTEHKLSVASKIFSLFILIIISVIFGIRADNIKREKDRKELSEKIRIENIKYFNENKSDVIASIKNKIDLSLYQEAISEADEYISSGNEQLKKLMTLAKSELEKEKQEERVAEDREKEIETQFSAWDGSHVNLTKMIKESMNDPDSYDHVKTVYWDKGDHLIVLTTFRGKNAFGGIIKNSVRAKIGIHGNIIQILEQF